MVPEKGRRGPCYVSRNEQKKKKKRKDRWWTLIVCAYPKLLPLLLVTTPLPVSIVLWDWPPPAGPEICMWPKHGQSFSICWWHWLISSVTGMQFDPGIFKGITGKDKLLQIFLAISIRKIDTWSCWELPYGEHLLENDVNTDEKEGENWVLMIWCRSSPWTQPYPKVCTFPTWEPVRSFRAKVSLS